MKWFLDRKPVLHQPWELYLMRAGFAWILFQPLRSQMNLHTQPFPNGLGHFADFTFLSNPVIWSSFFALTMAALVFYILGKAMLPVLTWLSFLLLATGTLQNSQGAIHHFYQPIVLIVIGQWILSLIGFFPGPVSLCRLWTVDLHTQQQLVQVAKIVLVSCYVTSAITKIERTDGQWMWRTPDLAVQVVKTNYDAYYTNGKKPGAMAEEGPRWMAENPNLTRLIIGPALLLELLAFLALFGRVPALVMGSALLAMHEGIDGLMQLDFWIWELLLLVFLINVPYWIARVFGKIFTGKIPSVAATP